MNLTSERGRMMREVNKIKWAIATVCAVIVILAVAVMMAIIHIIKNLQYDCCG